jgi:hypothetical protein
VRGEDRPTSLIQRVVHEDRGGCCSRLGATPKQLLGLLDRCLDTFPRRPDAASPGGSALRARMGHSASSRLSTWRAYSQFKRALARGNFIVAWGLAGELPQVQLADGLALLLLARDVEPARFDRGVPRWHARLCTERPLSTGEAQLALAALDALRGPGGSSAAQALAAPCEAHGLDREARILEDWAVARN